MKRKSAEITPLQFISMLHDPETNRPFVLLPAELSFFTHAFKTGPDGRLLYPELVFGAPKKSGKTTVAAVLTLTMTMLYGGRFGEGICAANSLEQSANRVFKQITRIIRATPSLAAVARITSDKIAIDGAEILAIPTDAGTAAGANPVVTTFDELWDFTSENERRFFDEMVPPPTRDIAARLTTTYAGYTGQSVLLEDLYNRGMAQPEIAPSLRAGDGILMFWSHDPIAPWQTESWLRQMRRQLRPLQYARMIQNQWVSAESLFVDPADFTRCVDPDLTQEIINRGLPIWIGLDGSVTRDWTAVVAVTIDRATGRLRLVWHRLFKPTPTREINFEDIIALIRTMSAKFSIQQIAYDPHQLASVSQRLTSEHLPMVKINQTSSNLTQIGSALYEAIKTHTITFYPDEDIRLSMNRAVAIESGSGWKIGKAKASDKVDFVVALAMACHAALEGLSAPQPLIVRREHVAMLASKGSHRSGWVPVEARKARMEARIGERRFAQMMQHRRRY